MITKKLSVLIVDDEQAVCDLLHDALNEQGYLCTKAFDGNKATTELAMQHFDVVLLDIRLPDLSGMEVLTNIRSNYPNTATIMITAINNADTAVEAMKLGASDYIVKPFDLEKVDASIQRVLENKKILPERRDYQALPCIGDQQGDTETIAQSFTQMNAIAYGVEARLDLLTSHSKIVIQMTADIAQQLDIPEKTIQRWKAIRSGHDSKRYAAIKSSLNKLERSPLAQVLMGMASPYLHIPKSDMEQKN